MSKNTPQAVKADLSENEKAAAPLSAEPLSAAPEKPAAAATQEAGSGLSLATPIAALALVLAIAAPLTAPLWQAPVAQLLGLSVPDVPMQPATAPATAQETQRLLVLEQIVVQQQKEMDALKAQLAALPTEPDVEIKTALDELTARLLTLSDAHDKLQQDFAKTAAMDMAGQAFLLSTLQLISAWQQGGNFAAPWAAVAASSEQLGPEIETLLTDSAALILPWRESGLPRVDQLREEFRSVAPLLLAAAHKVEGLATQSWWQQSLERIKGLVVIRRQGELIGEDVGSAEAEIAQAEQYLKDGALAQALAILARFDTRVGDTSSAPEGASDEAPDEAVVDWFASAHARVAADALSLKLTEAAGQLLSSAAEVAP
jgi:hypothetical protein